MKLRLRTVLSWLGVPILSASIVSTAYAQEPSLTVTQKKNFEQTMSEADAQTKSKLKKQYGDFEALMNASKDWDRKTASLHSQNTVKENALRKQIRKIDEAKLAKLKADAEQTEARYRKLFDCYKAVNSQLNTVRKLKNKTLTSLYQTQADALKVSVRFAKQDIQSKEDAYQTAKKSANAKMKKIRDSLSAIDPLEVQIRAAKNALKAPKDSRWSTWKSFTSSLTKTNRNAKTAANLLTSVNALTRQIVDSQQKIYNLENKIAEIIRKAESQLAGL